MSLLPDTFCSICSATIWRKQDGQTRTKTLNNAWKEFEAGDFTLAIMLSAVAVECELGRVFAKWKSIDSGLLTGSPSAFQKNQWVAEFRYGAFESLDRVCDFLTGQDFDPFVFSRSDLTCAIQERHPASASAKSLRKFFSTSLFWRRAEIVHGGRTDFGTEDAEEALRCALTLFYIISEMDFARRRTTEQNLRNPASRLD